MEGRFVRRIAEALHGHQLAELGTEISVLVETIDGNKSGSESLGNRFLVSGANGLVLGVEGVIPVA